jgi:hypothetical protein
MLHFFPESPDPFLKHDADMGLVKFGHLNAVIDNSNTLLGKLIGANLNTTADQHILIWGGENDRWVVTNIVFTNADAVINTATGGAFYTGPGQTGNWIASPVSASNIRFLQGPDEYVSISNAKWANKTTVGVGTSLYLSLTAPEGAAATCDVYVYGYKLFR